MRHGLRWTVAVALLASGVAAPARAGGPEAERTVQIRGHALALRTYGTPGGPAAIVASGDGGWTHLGPYVAESLSAQGWFVVGLDSKAYLSAFTSARSTLTVNDVPGDFLALVAEAEKGGRGRPVLIGVSEGAGLAVLAAADPAVKARVAGVVGLGLPERCELGWRWKDAIIYITKGVPKEPTFDTGEFVGRLAPLPLAAIHSTRDEFVPVDEIRRVMAKAGQPSRLWFVEAQNHRFSGNTGGFDSTLLEALSWIRQQRP